MRGILLLLLALACWSPRIHAQSCSAAAANLAFGNVSPITGAAVTGSSSLIVTCTWPLVTPQPFVQVCLNLNAPRPRMLTNGTNSLQYELYQDSARSLSWGSASNGTNPIAFAIAKPLLGTSASVYVPYYGAIAANQRTVPTSGNSSTTYAQTFSGAQAVLAYQFYTLVQPPCGALVNSTGFSFGVSAIVVNNCNVSATNLNFGVVGNLSSAITAQGGVTVQCTNGDAFRVSLNGGASGNVANRSLRLQGGADTVGYQLYLDAALSMPWGDGSNGTSRLTATGSGLPQSYTVYGRIPPQNSPRPGTYGDTITVTVEF